MARHQPATPDPIDFAEWYATQKELHDSKYSKNVEEIRDAKKLWRHVQRRQPQSQEEQAMQESEWTKKLEDVRRKRNSALRQNAEAEWEMRMNACYDSGSDTEREKEYTTEDAQLMYGNILSALSVVAQEYGSGNISRIRDAKPQLEPPRVPYMSPLFEGEFQPKPPATRNMISQRKEEFPLRVVMLTEFHCAALISDIQIAWNMYGLSDSGNQTKMLEDHKRNMMTLQRNLAFEFSEKLRMLQDDLLPSRGNKEYAREDIKCPPSQFDSEDRLDRARENTRQAGVEAPSLPRREDMPKRGILKRPKTSGLEQDYASNDSDTHHARSASLEVPARSAWRIVSSPTSSSQQTSTNAENHRRMASAPSNPNFQP